MKKYYIYQDEKSQKFWIIDNSELKITTHYGRIGTNGQTKIKELESQESADKEFNKLINQKIKKGYIETNQENIFNSKDESKRYFLSSDDVWDDEKNVNDLILKIKKDKKIATYKHITIGMWGEGYEDSCQPILDYFAENKDIFANLETLFIGDMDYEECELSWIEQGDYTEIFKTLTNLKKIKIKGSNGLKLSPINHEHLEHLEIICGGLPKNIFSELSKSNLPNLKTLVLYMGIENYGFDGSIDDIKLILKKELFPSLENLELVNSDIENEIVQEVIACNLLSQLKTVSFSYGGLSDIGGETLLNNIDALNHLNKINIDYHYLSEDMTNKLKKVFSNIKIINPQKPYDEDDDYFYPMLTE